MKLCAQCSMTVEDDPELYLREQLRSLEQKAARVRKALKAYSAEEQPENTLNADELNLYDPTGESAIVEILRHAKGQGKDYLTGGEIEQIVSAKDWRLRSCKGRLVSEMKSSYSWLTKVLAAPDNAIHWHVEKGDGSYRNARISLIRK
jgi:hypothetical protein